MDINNIFGVVFATLMVAAFGVFPAICLLIILFQGAMLLIKKNKIAFQDMQDRGIK